MNLEDFVTNFIEHVYEAPYRLQKLNNEKVKQIALKTAAVVLVNGAFTALATFGAPVIVAVAIISMNALATVILAGTYFTADEHAKTCAW
jgi:hypothetical protein